MFYAVAMVCTLIAWCAQAYTTVVKKELKLNPLLPLFYTIACTGFAIDSFQAGATMYAVIDAVVAVLALLIFIFMFNRKK